MDLELIHGLEHWQDGNDFYIETIRFIFSVAHKWMDSQMMYGRLEEDYCCCCVSISYTYRLCVEVNAETH